MSYKRVLTIQDISCLGQCSTTVALPILSACGHETVILPTAILSTHTGGFKNFTFRDLGEDISKIAAHWTSEGITFDCVYTGYLGSPSMVDDVRAIFANHIRENGLKIVDPAMADNGKLYYGFDSVYVDAMKRLCADADIVMPNISEACFLTGMEYRETYDEEYTNSLIKALQDIGCHDIVITGIGYREGDTGVLVCEKGKTSYYRHAKLSVSSHGTGDVYASAFTGAMLCGRNEYDAAVIAADYTVQCIKNTMGDKDHWYGVKFETALPKLIQMLA